MDCRTDRGPRGAGGAGELHFVVEQFIGLAGGFGGAGDGELTGVGRIVSDMQDQCLEVRHVENLREHYATTLKGWSENLAEHWDEALREVSLGRARVWGIYMAGSRLAFERNEIQLHHVLGVKPGSAGGAGSDGVASFPLRPTWVS